MILKLTCLNQYLDEKLSVLKVNPKDTNEVPTILGSTGYKIYVLNNVPPGDVRFYIFYFLKGYNSH